MAWTDSDLPRRFRLRHGVVPLISRSMDAIMSIPTRLDLVLSGLDLAGRQSSQGRFASLFALCAVAVNDACPTAQMASSLATSHEERIKELEKLKVADLRALCKEVSFISTSTAMTPHSGWPGCPKRSLTLFSPSLHQLKITGYSKAKRADLIAKLVQHNAIATPGQPSQSPSVLQSQSVASVATSVGQASTGNGTTASSPSALPTLVNTPSSSASHTALVTPTALPIAISNAQGNGLGSNVCLTESYPPTSSSPVLHSSPLLPYSTCSSRPIGSVGLTLDTTGSTSTSTIVIGQQRREERRQAATSLKEVVAKQRDAKRTAAEAGLASRDGPSKRVSHGMARLLPG